VITTFIIFFIGFVVACACIYGIFDNGKRTKKENWQIIIALSAFLAVLVAGYVNSQ